ncbi:hypothetical protein ABW21_db0200946 [Orbilia brochopaga]|nr:hypothetical protein ABW21_db0200946 [Drechslerella brochopaga]
MSKAMTKNEKKEAEQTLAAIRRDLEKLHRLAPESLNKPSFNAIVALLPSQQDILAAQPQKPATAATVAATSAFATLRFTHRVLYFTICRTLWLIIYALAVVGFGTVGFMFTIYSVARMPWTTVGGEGTAWREHSDGYYYFGMPQESYNASSFIASSATSSV